VPRYDYECIEDRGGCGFVQEVRMSFAEDDEVAARGGIDCPKCGKKMTKIVGGLLFHFPSVITDKGIKPTSKRGKAKEMEKRYDKRNKRLEAMDPATKKRMERFFSRRGVRRSPPPSSEHS
jgi:hypothetical protein